MSPAIIGSFLLWSVTGEIIAMIQNSASRPWITLHCFTSLLLHWYKKKLIPAPNAKNKRKHRSDVRYFPRLQKPEIPKKEIICNRNNIRLTCSCCSAFSNLFNSTLLTPSLLFLFLPCVHWWYTGVCALLPYKSCQYIPQAHQDRSAVHRQ